ncbi:serine-rich adhesin for platelets [Rhagoletis pomonella]|uniref:serine-rich adhesin for platelets n=1 Tax=Rhagoletis pomonella TaxID=28610 RepID=UPI0017849B9C|nr:serine-rich adhesin for platelets [Rhagoletis pomonella]
MPKRFTTTLFELLIFGLFAQVFAGVLSPAQILRQPTQPSFDDAVENSKAVTASDRDIAAVVAATATDRGVSYSDDQIKLKLKSVEGIAANANTADAGGESESKRVEKSTKLLPALGNNHTSAGEHKSSEKLILNRVESHETDSANGQEEAKTVEGKREEEEERERESQDERDSEEAANKHLGANNAVAEQQIVSNKHTGGVFSQADETAEKSRTRETLKTHVNNGLDELALRLNNEKTKSNEFTEVKDEPPATTEGILKDVEDVAVKVSKATTDRPITSEDRTEDAGKSVASVAESRHKAESLDEASETMGRSMDAVQSSENKLEAAFGEKALSEEMRGKEIMVTSMPKPILATKSGTEETVSSLGKGENTGMDLEATTKPDQPTQNKHQINQTETDVPAQQQLLQQKAQAAEIDLQQQPRSSAAVTIEAETDTMTTTAAEEMMHTQEEVANQSHISSSTSSAEKRGKFISGNSTNSRNMNLPDAPEVWSLAGMRMVPKVMHNNGTSTQVTDESRSSANSRWQLNEIVTTERTPNVSSYSEKNLLDWTKVMGMRGELETHDAVERNHITEGTLEEDGIETGKEPKTDVPLQALLENWRTEGPSQIEHSTKNNESTFLQTTEGNAKLNVSEKSTVTYVMNEIDTLQTIAATTTTIAPTGLTNTQTPLANDSPLSIDKNNKHADFIATIVAADVGESLNNSLLSSTASTESPTQRQSADPTAVGNLSAVVESNTQQQASDDFNFIVTSTTPVAVVWKEADTAAANVKTSAITTTAASLPVEQSTSTTSPSHSDASATPKLWANATALETQPETTLATLLSKVNAGVNATERKVVVSSNDSSIHDVTLEQQASPEHETLSNETETGTATEEQTPLLTVSELPSSETHGSTSAGEQKSNANVNANANATVETGAGIWTQNRTPNVATETTTESSNIATTSTINFLNNTTTTLSTDLVETNASAKPSEVPTLTVTERATTAPTTTEVGQIGNEVELEARTVRISVAAEGQTDAPTATLNTDTGSSTIEVVEETATAIDEASATATTVSSINELLMPVNVTTTIPTTNTTSVPITTTPTRAAVEPVLYEATTLKSDESVNDETTTTTSIPLETITVQATGSVHANSAATTTATPVDFRNHTAEAAVEGAHDTESSIETNVIDQLDKTTAKISETSATKPTNSTESSVAPAISTTEVAFAKENAGLKGEADASQTVTISGTSNETLLPGMQDADRTTTSTTTTTDTSATTTTTMANILLSTNSTPVWLAPEYSNFSTSDTTTTEPPLINLLDDSSTPRTTTPIAIPNQSTATISSIGVKPQEVYTVFSTTEGTTTTVSTSTAAIAPLVPMLSSTTAADAPLETSTSTYMPAVVTSTIATAITTTILPPTLHAAIGEGASIGGGGGAPTHLPDMINAGMRPNPSDANETDVNVIIAITVSIIGVVALILLVAFLYLMRKRQKQMSYGQRCRPVSLDAYSLDNVSVLGSVRRKGASRASKRSYGNIAFDDPSLRHNALTAAELAKFVERRSSIFEEFRDVPQIIARADEVPPGCEDKNRYANVIPLPETRVVLQQLGDDDKTEYINANYVRGPKDAPNYYIATQAPLETTVVDFWRMIWEQQSRVIIQATDLYENGIEKCAEYLPPSVTLDNHTTYGDFQITLKHREVKDKYAISTLMLKNTAENMSRELTHYWYKWPETGVPSEEAPIIAMLLEARSSLKGYVNEVREKSSNAERESNADGEVTSNGNGVTVISMEDVGQQKTTETGRANGAATENGGGGGGGGAEINGNVSIADKVKGTTLRNQGPLTIHCSPGTGRTGTIIACDMAIRNLETPKRSVDIPQIVYYVRRGRASAVQTKEQYEFIYKVAHMYATKITNLSNDN